MKSPWEGLRRVAILRLGKFQRVEHLFLPDLTNGKANELYWCYWCHHVYFNSFENLLNHHMKVHHESELGTKKYLSDLIQMEIDFQNRRLDAYSKAQKKRMQGLEENLENFTRQREQLQRRINETRDPIAMLAMQQGIDNASSRISSIRLELDTYELLNASDLYIDTTQIIRDPIIVASSNWYRPIIFGAVGLAIGLFLTLVIAIIAVLRAFSRKKKTRDEEKNARAQKNKTVTEQAGTDESP